MSETTLNWDDLRLFIEVARAGGLAGAEDLTGKSAPTLGRRMVALERIVGRDLFLRTVRGYELTTEGHTLLDSLKVVENTLLPLAESSANAGLAPVKLSAGAWVTHYLCCRVVDWPQHSVIPLQFIAADQVLEIAHRETVIGIRNERPSQSSLACQPLNQIQFATYAVHRNVKTWVQVLGSTPSARWVRDHAGKEFSVRVTHPRNALDLALSGACRAVLPTFIGDNTHGLQKVSDDITELSHRQWLVVHQDDRHRPEVREVVNWLKAILGHSQTIV